MFKISMTFLRCQDKYKRNEVGLFVVFLLFILILTSPFRLFLECRSGERRKLISCDLNMKQLAYSWEDFFLYNLF